MFLPLADCVCRHKPGFLVSAAGDTSPIGATSSCLPTRSVPARVNIIGNLWKGKTLSSVCSSGCTQRLCIPNSNIIAWDQTLPWWKFSHFPLQSWGGAVWYGRHSFPCSICCDKLKCHTHFAKALLSDGWNPEQLLDFKSCRGCITWNCFLPGF